MCSQIQVSVYKGEIETNETDLLDAVLRGLLNYPGKLSDAFLSSVAVVLVDDVTDKIDPMPFVLVPGFTDFARKLLEKYPDFCFVADVYESRFFHDMLLALSGNIATVQQGETGRIYASFEQYALLASAEVERFRAICVERTDIDPVSLEICESDLIDYLECEVQ